MYREELEPGQTARHHLEREPGKGTVEVVGAATPPDVHVMMEG